MRPGVGAICAFGILGIAFGVWSAARAGAQTADSLTVDTVQGRVHGKTIAGGKVRAFLGLPYAAAPVGDLRWRPPMPPARWRSTRDATRYGAHCMQGHPFEDIQFQDAGPSEDCLFLNVFTSADAGPKSKLPVMFWIHGGGYVAGSGSEPRHSGDALPTRGVVLVTINYRLGVFGFLAAPELVKEGNGAAGNYGLLDQMAALEWVKENIARFGGDPGNVTIFGESAGSFSVSLLMAAAPARGLFAKAIGESGGALNVGGPTEPSFLETEAKDQAWVNSLGIDVAHLRLLPAQEVLLAASRSDAPHWDPVVDGRLLTAPVAVTYAAGQQAHIPLLAGWNRDEQFSLSLGMTAAKWKQFAEQRFGDKAAEFLKLYPGDTDEQAVRSAIDYQSDDFIAAGTWRWIEAQVKTGDAPVYRYFFELPAPPSKYHPGSYAFHSDDIEYVFGTLDTRPGAAWRPEDRTLSDEAMTYWTNFAKTGDPNGGGLPDWPRYDRTGLVLHFGSTITTAPDTQQARYEFVIANRKKPQ